MQNANSWKMSIYKWIYIYCLASLFLFFIVFFFTWIMHVYMDVYCPSGKYTTRRYVAHEWQSANWYLYIILCTHVCVEITHMSSGMKWEKMIATVITIMYGSDDLINWEYTMRHNICYSLYHHHNSLLSVAVFVAERSACNLTQFSCTAFLSIFNALSPSGHQSHLRTSRWALFWLSDLFTSHV